MSVTTPLDKLRAGSGGFSPTQKRELGSTQLLNAKIKEEIGVNTPLFPTARGILAEFKIVGTFEARPRAAVAAPGS